jgi:hypothetical protein
VTIKKNAGPVRAQPTRVRRPGRRYSSNAALVQHNRPPRPLVHDQEFDSQIMTKRPCPDTACYAIAIKNQRAPGRVTL